MIDIGLIKQPEENVREYIWRVCQFKENHCEYTWTDIAAILNENIFDDKADYMGESAFRKQYQYAKQFYEDVFSKVHPSDVSDDIGSQIAELKKERYKLQTEKLDYFKSLREDARDDLFQEKVIDAIRRYGSDDAIPEPKYLPHNVYNDKCGVLCIADCHFGKEYSIKGVHGEIINEYSPEIFFKRMDKLLTDTIDIVEKEGLIDLRVYNLGDSVDGFLRNSQIWSLKYGVIDSAIIFGNYFSDWLKKLSAHVRVWYSQTDGNHDELRLLDGKKNAHLNESAGKIVKNIIEIRNENNPNLGVVDNPTGFIYDNVAGYEILGIHGEVSNLSKAIKEFSNMYNTNISYLLAGHKHHREFTECGVRKACIGVGSVIGVDGFSTSLRRTADPTSSLFIFEKGVGKTVEYTIVLN